MHRVLPALLLTLALGASPALGQTGAEPPSAQPTAPGESPTVSTAPPEVPSWGSLFGELGGDFKRLPSRETAIILGAGGALSLAVHENDVTWTERASASQALDVTFESGAVLGGGAIQIGGAFGTYAFGRFTNHPQVARIGADLFRAQMVNAVLTQGIKFIADRPRPDGGRYSFPSGHTSGTFATAAVLQRYFGWKVGVPAYGFASWVAGSRLQGNKHFMSDVMFGAALGIVSGRTVTVGHGKATFAVTPIAAPGGGGIGLSLLGAQ